MALFLLLPQPSPPNLKPPLTLLTQLGVDSVLLGFLTATLDESIAPLVTQIKSSHEASSTLSLTFRTKSTYKSPDQIINDYIHQIKTCTLEHVNLGKPMDSKDIIVNLFRGLHAKHYRAIKETIETHDTPISFHALH